MCVLYVVSRNRDFLKSILFCIQINYYFFCVLLDFFCVFFFFASRLKGFTNEFMFMSPQYYLVEMTEYSLLCWARSKKHTIFKEKNVFQIHKFFYVYKIIIRTFFSFLPETRQLMSLHVLFYDLRPLNNQDCSFLACSQLQLFRDRENGYVLQ